MLLLALPLVAPTILMFGLLGLGQNAYAPFCSATLSPSQFSVVNTITYMQVMLSFIVLLLPFILTTAATVLQVVLSQAITIPNLSAYSSGK